LGFLLRFWYYFRWVHLPAYGFLILWFILQIALFAHQQLGAGGVAATAHLGGAFVGAAAWLLWRTYTGGQKSLSVL
jgi:membrane associated rhomboid family serine protease